MALAYEYDAFMASLSDANPQYSLLTPTQLDFGSMPAQAKQIQSIELAERPDFSAAFSPESLSADESSFLPPSSKRASTGAKKVMKPKKEKSAHNMTEKKYRTNINDKMKMLSDCVPTLSILNDGEAPATANLDGLQPARKLNKATILSKATEYIQHLETKNRQLVEENQKIRNMLRFNSSEFSEMSSNVSSVSGSPKRADSEPNALIYGMPMFQIPQQTQLHNQHQHQHQHHQGHQSHLQHPGHILPHQHQHQHQHQQHQHQHHLQHHLQHPGYIQHNDSAEQVHQMLYRQ